MGTYQAIKPYAGPIFDAHMHIINPKYPLQPNNGFTPAPFTTDDYLNRMDDEGGKGIKLMGGAVVSGSFQGMDQYYAIDALGRLGNGFVGITQIPHDIRPEELEMLHALGIRGIRFNLYRGGSESVEHLEFMANRVYEQLGWHVELYADAATLANKLPMLTKLPALSIDHLGLSQEGLPIMEELVASGAKVKVTGLGRGNIDVPMALDKLYNIDHSALMFGTDWPGTRSKAFEFGDMQVIVDTLGEYAARRVFYTNAKAFYMNKTKAAKEPIATSELEEEEEEAVLAAVA